MLLREEKATCVCKENGCTSGLAVGRGGGDSKASVIFCKMGEAVTKEGWRWRGVPALLTLPGSLCPGAGDTGTPRRHAEPGHR